MFFKFFKEVEKKLFFEEIVQVLLLPMLLLAPWKEPANGREPSVCFTNCQSNVWSQMRPSFRVKTFS